MRGLFINNKKAKDSIYESGVMVFECLKLSKQFELDYTEVDADHREIATGYDFYFLNYHPITMAWLQTRNLKKELGLVITMILEVAPNDAFVYCPEHHFDVYCALDPTIPSQRNLYAFPRPLEKFSGSLDHDPHEIPVIGSFGFGTKGKGFQHVVEAVNKEFEQAIIKINIPYGDFIPDSKEYAFYLGDVCRKTANPGIEVQVTHDFMSKDDLIRWCAANTLNCFLYDRQMPGLSATTDQAIVSERPMAVSDNDTFRHITAYLAPYPKLSLKDAIANAAPIIQKIKSDWQPEKFTARFEEILGRYTTALAARQGSEGGTFQLPLKTKNFQDTFDRKLKKWKRKFKNFDLKKNFSKKKDEKVI